MEVFEIFIVLEIYRALINSKTSIIDHFELFKASQFFLFLDIVYYIINSKLACS